MDKSPEIMIIKKNFFVQISSLERITLLLIYLTFFIVVAITSIFNQTTGATKICLSLSFLILIYIYPFITKKKFGFFHPVIFSSIIFLFELLQNFFTYSFGLQNNLGLFGYTATELSNVVSLSLIYLGIARLSYYFGFFITPRVDFPHIRTKIPSNITRLFFVTTVLFLIVFAIYLQTRGGIIQHLLFLGKGRTNLIDNGELTGEWGVFSRIGIICCILWFLSDSKIRRKSYFWIISGLCILPPYLAAGSRSSLVNFIIIWLIAYFISSKKIDYGKLGLLAFIFLLLIGFLGLVRKSSWRGDINLQNIAEDNNLYSMVQSAITEMDYRATTVNPLYPIIARVPEINPQLNGKSYISILAIPIPRAWWPNKPRTTGSEIGDTFFGQKLQVPPSPVAEEFWNFNILGIVIINILFGVFHKFVAKSFERNSDSPAFLLLYSITLFLFSPATYSIIYWAQTFGTGLLFLFIFRYFDFQKS